MRVLIVEDDRLLGETLKEVLEGEGFEVVWIRDSTLALETFKKNPFDLIILDLIMPKKRGEELLREVREMDEDVPIIVLTAKARLYDKKVCFSLGADDYITKPVEMEELLLRIRAVLKRARRSDIVKVGDTKINLKEGYVEKEGRIYVLSKVELEILKVLTQNLGKAVNSKEIIPKVWGDREVSDSLLRVYIKRLRKLLPIENLKGRGYRLRPL